MRKCLFFLLKVLSYLIPVGFFFEEVSIVTSKQHNRQNQDAEKMGECFHISVWFILLIRLLTYKNRRIFSEYLDKYIKM